MSAPANFRFFAGILGSPRSLLIVFGAFAVIFSVLTIYQQRSVEKSFHQRIGVWGAAIAEVIVNEDITEIERIVKLSTTSDIQSITVFKNLDDAKILYSYPYEHDVENCSRSFNEKISVMGQPVGHIRACTTLPLLMAAVFRSPLFLVMVSLFIICLLVFSLNMVFAYRKSLNDTVEFFDKWSNDPKQETADLQRISGAVDRQLFDFFTSGLEARTKAERLEGELQAERKITSFHQRIAHDCRSTLTAVRSICSYLQEESSTPEVVVTTAKGVEQEVSAIISDLEVAKNPVGAAVVQQEISAEPVYLYSLIEQVIHLKRSEHPQLDVSYRFHRMKSPFVRVNDGLLRRNLSNIINNSVEATDDPTVLGIEVNEIDGMISIEVSDNGPGIPPEIHNRLGREPVTVGKPGGTGSGLFHCAQDLRRWRGRMEVVQDNRASGAVIRLHLPVAEPPKWYREEFEPSTYQSIVVLDDDPSILGTWRLYLEIHGFSGKLELYSSPSELDSQMAEKASSQDSLWLIDHNLHDPQTTGFDFILKHRLENRALLATFDYDCPEMQARCEENGVKISPKVELGWGSWCGTFKIQQVGRGRM